MHYVCGGFSACVWGGGGGGCCRVCMCECIYLRLACQLASAGVFESTCSLLLLIVCFRLMNLVINESFVS